MMVHDFPGCCSAQVIGDLGGTKTSYGRTDKIETDTLIKEIVEYRWFKTDGIISATTNSDQREAAKALRKLGFKSSVSSKSGNHGKKIRIWYIDASVLRENIQQIRKEM